MKIDKTFEIIRHALHIKVIRYLATTLSVATILLAVTGGYWLKISYEHQTLTQAMQAMIKAETARSERKELDAYLKDTMPLLLDIERSSGVALSRADAMKMLNAVAQHNQLRIMNISYKRQENKAGPAQFDTYEVTVVGRYVNVKRALSEIARFPAWSLVTDINLEKIYNSSGELNANFLVAVMNGGSRGQ